MDIGNESETREFKESLSQLDKGIISIAMMLNKRCCGELFIGVRDDGFK